MKLLIDECLSHTHVWRRAERGYPDAVHPIHIGLRRARDDQLASRALAEDRVIISGNARHYRRLLEVCELHPGAILVEPVELEATWYQIAVALSHIEQQPRPWDYMVNRIVEISARQGLQAYLLP